MPVERFRSLDEANDALERRQSGAASLAARVQRLWETSARLAPAVPAPGVQRFRSIDDANDEQERRDDERVRRVQARLRAQRRA